MLFSFCFSTMLPHRRFWGRMWVPNCPFQAICDWKCDNHSFFFFFVENVTIHLFYCWKCDNHSYFFFFVKNVTITLPFSFLLNLRQSLFLFLFCWKCDNHPFFIVEDVIITLFFNLLQSLSFFVENVSITPLFFTILISQCKHKLGSIVLWSSSPIHFLASEDAQEMMLVNGHSWLADFTDVTLVSEDAI